MEGGQANLIFGSLKINPLSLLFGAFVSFC
jgi:hypothetical protein